MVVLGAIVALFFLRTGKQDAPEASAEAAGADRAEASVPAETTAASPAAHAPARAESHDGGPLDRTVRIDAAKRVLLLSAISKALAEKPKRGAGDTKGPPGRPSDAVHPFEADYLGERIDEIRPLVQKCYDDALVENPSLSGTITLRITVVGDEDLGGLITDSQVVDDDAADASLTECVRENMYALRLKAPEGRGTATVTSRYVFKRSDGGQE